MDNNQLNLFEEISTIEMKHRRKNSLQKFREVYRYNRHKYCGECEKFVNSKCKLRGNGRINPKDFACNQFLEVKSRRVRYDFLNSSLTDYLYELEKALEDRYIESIKEERKAKKEV